MNIRQAYLKMIRSYPGGWDAMAAALGMTRDALENRIYERRGQSINVDTAMQMQAFSSITCFAEAVANLSGGVFVKLPEALDAGNDELLKKWNDLYAQIGGMSGTFSAAIEDDHVDAKERKSLEAHGHEINRLVQELLVLTVRVYSRGE